MSRYWKAIIAAVAAIAITGVQAYQSAAADGVWTGEDTAVTAIAILGAILVYAKANETTNPSGVGSPDISEANRPT